MDKFLIIKNGLVLTLDRKKRAGNYNIISKNGKIFLIDYERKFNEREFISKNPDAKIIDASGKLVMPGFFNSRLFASYAMCGLFFKNCNYENINSWLSLRLVDKFLSNPLHKSSYETIMKIAFQRSLLSGEIFVNENPLNPGYDFAIDLISDTDWIKQYFNFTTYAAESAQNVSLPGLSVSYRADENINNYSLSSLKKNLSAASKKLFVESSLSSGTVESIKRVFGKPFVNVLSEMELIGPNTILSNPLQIGKGELEILLRKDSAVCISPGDYINLSDRRFDIEEIMNSGLRIVTGTGFTGISILDELKTLSSMLPMKNYSYEDIIQTAILNPSMTFGISNITGSVEKTKSCDLIMFDISDLRTMFTVPEPTSEFICEFIIRNLSAKDITDVTIKGEVLIEDRKNNFEYLKAGVKEAVEISEKLYDAGKLREFREKYMMRGRVNKLLVGSEEDYEDYKPEVFVDMTETEEYIGEGEFTIIGAREEEFEKSRAKKEEDDTPKINLKEIKSLDTELNLFDEKDFEKKPGPEKIIGRDFADRKASRKSAAAKKKEDVPNIFDKNDESIESPPVKTEIKKSNMKFGFGNDE